MFRKSLLVIVAALVVAGGLQAQDGLSDPLLQAAADAGLLQVIGESQTIDGVTVTLNWVYVDTQQLIISYTTSDIDPLLVYSFFGPGVVLQDADGSIFSYAGASTEALVPDVITLTARFYNQAMQPGADGAVEIINDFFNTYYDTLPETIDLKLEISLGDFTIDEWVPEELRGEREIGTYIEPVGPFSFSFTAALNEAITLEPMQTLEVAGLAVTLESLTLAPTAAQARLCYELPDSRDWVPQASITISEVTGYMNGHGVSSLTEFDNTERRCRNIGFSVFYDGTPGLAYVSLDVLETSMPEGPGEWEQIEAVLAEDDIDIDVIFEQGERGGGGIRIEEVDVPADFDLQAAIEAAREKLGNRIIGPWVFEVTLP